MMYKIRVCVRVRACVRVCARVCVCRVESCLECRDVIRHTDVDESCVCVRVRVHIVSYIEPH